MLSFLFYLQEKIEEPFEITIFSFLAGFIFCGLLALVIGLFYGVLIRPVQNRKDAFSRWVSEQEKEAEKKQASDRG